MEGPCPLCPGRVREEQVRTYRFSTYSTLTPSLIVIQTLVHSPFRDVHDPRALAAIFAKAEADLADRKHPDPYRRKWTCCPGRRRVFICWYSSPRGPGWHEVVRTLLCLLQEPTWIHWCAWLCWCRCSGSATYRYVIKPVFACRCELTIL